MYRELLEKALEQGFPLLADGTLIQDLDEDRPGLRAVRELSVLTPLLEAGFLKEELRSLASLFHPLLSRKPPSACLATRFLTGETITLSKLNKIVRTEALLSALGFKIFRVRLRAGELILELCRKEWDLFWEEKETIERELKALGFERILWALSGYQRLKRRSP
jgi:uncharacterized protein